MLYHSHLPQLGNTGVVSWDRDEKTFSHGAEFEDLKSLSEVTAPLVDLLAKSDGR